MKEELAKRFSANLARLRSQKQWTQKELAELLHVDKSLIAKWETGKVFPRRATAERLAEALGVSTQELTSDGVEEPNIVFDDQAEDPELNELIRCLRVLDARDRDALKIVIEGLLTRYQLKELASQPGLMAFKKRAG